MLLLYTLALQNTPLIHCKPDNCTKPLYRTKSCTYSTRPLTRSTITLVSAYLQHRPPTLSARTLQMYASAYTVGVVSDIKRSKGGSHSGGRSIRTVDFIVALPSWHCKLILSLLSWNCHYGLHCPSGLPPWHCHYGLPS